MVKLPGAKRHSDSVAPEVHEGGTPDCAFSTLCLRVKSLPSADKGTQESNNPMTTPPDAKSTDPKLRGLMQGFPPPPDKQVNRLNGLWVPPYNRWAYQNMLTQFGGKGKLVAVVSDSYDIYNAVENIWCGLLLDVNNVHVSGHNLGFDPLDYLSCPAPEIRVQYAATLARISSALLVHTKGRGF